MQSKETILTTLAKTQEDRVLLASVFEKIETAQEKHYMTHTRFLDTHQRTLCQQAVRALGRAHACAFFGGYADAERVLLLCLPDYMTQEDAPENAPIALLRAQKHKEDSLTHRDYLGTLMGLQMKREMLGDILVHDTGADIFVMESIVPFLETEWSRVGRKRVEIARVPLADYRVQPPEVREGSGAVASLRLDAVIALVYRLSRAQAQAKIAQGLVSVNHMVVQKDTVEIAAGDKLVVRGMGKAIVTDLGGQSRKGRQFLTYQVLL